MKSFNNLNSYFNFIEHKFEKQTFKAHFHTNYSIGLILEGIHRLDLDGKELFSKKGKIKVINPYEIHIADGNLSWKYINFMPSEEIIKDIAQQICDDEILYKIKFHNIIEDLKANKMFLNLYNNIDEDKILFEENMIEFIAYLLQKYAYKSLNAVEKHTSIKNSLEFIHAYFLENITLEELVDISGISKYHLIKTFKKKTGLTPHQFILGLRVDYGMKLILKGEKPSLVSSMCGFSDQSHFIKTFRKFNGYTPNKIVS